MHVPAWPVLPSSTLAPDAIRAKFAPRSLMGLGTMICDTETCYDDGTQVVTETFPPTPTGDSSGVNLCSMYPSQSGCPGAPIAALPPVTVGQNVGVTVPAQNSQQWGILAAQLLKSGMTLAQIQAIQPGTVVSANGAILRQSPGFAVPTPNTSTQFGLQASPNTTTLLIAGLAVVAVMFMGGRGGR